MLKKYAEIKGRYRDVMCQVDERQMASDLQDLISYVDALHTVLVHQAQAKAVEEMLKVFESDKAGMRVPC